MADSTIGAIRAILQLDTAAFSSGAKEAEGSLASLEAKFTSTAKKLAAGLGITLAAKEFVDSIKHMINQADELGKAAQKFGVGVEPLSALKFAADLADVSFEGLGKGLGKLSKAILDGAVNPSGEAAKSFKALGISVRDSSGAIKPTEEIFSDIAAKFANMEDGAAKTAIAIRVFGKSGAELIPLLNEGRTGIKALTDEAKRLGIVISAETAAKAQEFNDTLKRLHTSTDVLYLKLAEALLPGLQKIANAFLQAKGEGEGFSGLIKQLGETFNTDVEDVLKFQNAIAGVGNILIAFKDVYLNLFSGTENLTAAWGRFTKALDNAKVSFATLRDSFASLGKAGAFESMDNLFQQIEKVRRGMGGLNEDALKVKDSFEKWLDSTKRQADAQTISNKTIGEATGFAERYKFMTEAIERAKEGQIDVEGKVKQKIDETAASIQLLAQSAELKQFIEQGKTDWEKYLESIEKVKTSIATFPDQAAALNKTMAKMQQDMANNIAAQTATALGGFSQLLFAAAGTNKKLFEAAKAFAIAEAIVNTYKAANQALTAPPGPPFSYIYVAGAIAAGLANVIKISSQQAPKAATGGSFRVPGGSMGVDTGIFPLRLAPGELVDVTPASRAQSRGGSNSVLQIPAISPRDFFTGDTVRYMVESIDKWMRDGGTGIRMVPR